jgi:hypothetical protein
MSAQKWHLLRHNFIKNHHKAASLMVILCFVLTKNMLIFGCEAVLAKAF